MMRNMERDKICYSLGTVLRFAHSFYWPSLKLLQESSQAQEKAEEALRRLRKTPEAVPGAGHMC